MRTTLVCTKILIVWKIRLNHTNFRNFGSESTIEGLESEARP